MSTRSIVRVFSGPDEICTIYRHHDGYPSAMGADMVSIVGQRRIVNWFTACSQDSGNEVNGAGRMAALIIHELHEHDPSILPTGTADAWQDYEYHVRCPSLAEVNAKHRTERSGEVRGLPVTLTAWECGTNTIRQLSHVDRYEEDEEDEDDK